MLQEKVARMGLAKEVMEVSLLTVEQSMMG
jgi:hypothetical protein